MTLTSILKPLLTTTAAVIDLNLTLVIGTDIWKFLALIYQC